ncbi:hypothetical protein NT2_09_01520 [Caenibius tardaugens NBRC 16725]|uniref:Transporter n=1 Tax=Caenibius tardaugens NBRC 16725 TaxID=1219035 RepID=U2ZYT2_9SPHN|nr:AI-2E family transporter [Caenibius tardaugens]GAD50544.1 hypothetical protein NT2_09_01520 [Caenibius tardaugens NBRC 16725]
MGTQSDAEGLSKAPLTGTSKADDVKLRLSPLAEAGSTSLFHLAVGVVIIAALYFARDVLIPVTLAVVLSFVLSPIVGFLQRILIPRGPASVLSVLIALGIISSIGTVVGTQMVSLSDQMPQYVQTLQGKIDAAQNFAKSEIAVITNQLEQSAKPRLPGSSLQPQPVPHPSPANSSATESLNPLETAFGLLGSILAPFETFIIVLVVTIFILLQSREVHDKTIRLFGSSDLLRTTAALDDVGARLSRYLLSQLVVNTGFGLIIGIGTWLIGLPVPLVWGVLAGMLRFVPYIGAILGAILPMIVAAAIEPGWSSVAYVAILFAVVEPVTGYAVEPLLYGHSTGLSPLAVVVAAIFWTWIWGPIGLVLSMPLTLSMVTLGHHIPNLKFLEILLGDQPALSPAEYQYQRLLAGNLDGSIDQALTAIEDNGSLSQYYDEVILPALRLADNDIQRGAINKATAGQLASNALNFLEDLTETEMAERLVSSTASQPRSTSVVCLAGPGPLDEVATTMLCQLLAQNGIPAELHAFPAISRRAIDALELSGAHRICLISVNRPPGSPRIRAMIHRIQQKTDAAIVVGLTGHDTDDGLTPAKVLCAATFTQAISLCSA